MISGEPAHDNISGNAPGELPPIPERKLPPITETAVGSMILVLVAGIYLASHLPRGAPLAPAAGLLIAAAILMAGNLLALSRLRMFAWKRFRIVFGWALLAYVVIAGMIEFTFLLDGIPGGPLLVMSCSLLIFAIDIPLLLAFSVARYDEA